MAQSMAIPTVMEQVQDKMRRIEEDQHKMDQQRSQAMEDQHVPAANNNEIVIDTNALEEVEQILERRKKEIFAKVITQEDIDGELHQTRKLQKKAMKRKWKLEKKQRAKQEKH